MVNKARPKAGETTFLVVFLYKSGVVSFGEVAARSKKQAVERARAKPKTVVAWRTNYHELADVTAVLCFSKKEWTPVVPEDSYV